MIEEKISILIDEIKFTRVSGFPINKYEEPEGELEFLGKWGTEETMPTLKVVTIKGREFETKSSDGAEIKYTIGAEPKAHKILKPIFDQLDRDVEETKKYKSDISNLNAKIFTIKMAPFLTRLKWLFVGVS